MSARDSRLALSSPLFACRPFRWRQAQRDVGTAQRRREEHGPRTDRRGERERTPRGRAREGSGEGRGRRDREAERAGRERRESRCKGSAQRRSAVSGSAEQHFVERRCTRRIEVPMAAERAGPPWPRSPRRARRNPRRLRRKRRGRPPAGTRSARAARRSRTRRRSCSALGPPHALAASAVGLGVRA